MGLLCKQRALRTPGRLQEPCGAGNPLCLQKLNETLYYKNSILRSANILVRVQRECPSIQLQRRDARLTRPATSYREGRRRDERPEGGLG